MTIPDKPPTRSIDGKVASETQGKRCAKRVTRRYGDGVDNVGVNARDNKTQHEAKGPTRQGLNRGNRRYRYMKPLERITTPMVRENGELRAATWDEALNRAADAFARIRDKYGGETFGMFSCSKSTNEMNYAAQKFIRTAMGSNNIDSCNRT